MTAGSTAPGVQVRSGNSRPATFPYLQDPGDGAAPSIELPCQPGPLATTTSAAACVIDVAVAGDVADPGDVELLPVIALDAGRGAVQPTSSSPATIPNPSRRLGRTARSAATEGAGQDLLAGPADRRIRTWQGQDPTGRGRLGG